MRTHPSEQAIEAADKTLAIERINLVLQQDHVTDLFCESLADELETLRPPLSLPPHDPR